MASSLSIWARAALVVTLASALGLAVNVVLGWRADSADLATLKPVVATLASERDEKAAQVLELTSTVGALKLAIAEQNHAVELAEAEAKTAKALQAQAQAGAAKLATQMTQRIADLETDLADASKTITDLLDKSWSQHHEP